MKACAVGNFQYSAKFDTEYALRSWRMKRPSDLRPEPKEVNPVEYLDSMERSLNETFIAYWEPGMLAKALSEVDRLFTEATGKMGANDTFKVGFAGLMSGIGISNEEVFITLKNRDEAEKFLSELYQLIEGRQHGE